MPPHAPLSAHFLRSLSGRYTSQDEDPVVADQHPRISADRSRRETATASADPDRKSLDCSATAFTGPSNPTPFTLPTAVTSIASGSEGAKAGTSSPPLPAPHHSSAQPIPDDGSLDAHATDRTAVAGSSSETDPLDGDGHSGKNAGSSPTTAPAVDLGDFSAVYTFLQEHRLFYDQLAEQRIEATLSFLSTAQRRKEAGAIPVDGHRSTFREISNGTRKDYFEHSPYLADVRDGSVRRPRGPTNPPPLSNDNPAPPMLSFEHYYTPLRPRSLVSIEKLAQSLPGAFPEEAPSLSKFRKNPELGLGDRYRAVEWSEGVGKMVRDDSVAAPSVGYTGGVGSEKKGGVHLFLDHSNIFLSFLASLPDRKIQGVPHTAKKTLSIPVLTLLLARGRPIKPGRMHLVGSSPLMQDLDPAVRLGWECCVLKRVPADVDTEMARAAEQKLKPPPKAKRGKLGSSSSESEEPASASATATDKGGWPPRDPTFAVRKNREQAVDEMLQLKLLQTLLRNGGDASQVGTIVLATGDAKGGQFNEHGFLGAVRDALRSGWKVELWSFATGLSRAWTQVAQKEEWGKGGRFKLCELDEWLDELVDTVPR